MRKAITVSLPEPMARELERITKKDGVSRSEIMRESLRDYLWRREFEELRRRMVARARAQGVFTDEDVFELVS